jgi:hydrogenase nickel incorporation protein HypA/HybF
MHELSVALSIIESVEEQARVWNGSRVLAVHVRIGPLSGVVPDALMFAYGLACEGTSLQGSRLAVEERPVVIECPRCAAETVSASAQDMTCSVCGSAPARVVSGDELDLVAVEVE